MKKIIFKIILLISIIHSSGLKAQVIDNKVDISISYGIINQLGSKDIDENGFVTPSLFYNYQNGLAITLRGTYNYIPNVSFGIELKRAQFDNWSYFINPEIADQHSSTIITSFAPFIKFHSKFKNEGIFNRIQLYAILAPSINFIYASLTQGLFDEIPSSPESSRLLQDKTNSYGGSIYTGVVYSISQKIDIFAEAGLHYTNVKGQLYNDKSLIALNINVGLVFKLLKNKRYYL